MTTPESSPSSPSANTAEELPQPAILSKAAPPLLGIRLAQLAAMFVWLCGFLIGIWFVIGILLTVVLVLVTGTAGYQAWKDWFEQPLGTLALMGYVGPLLTMMAIGWGIGTLARAAFIITPGIPSVRWLAAGAVIGRLATASAIGMMGILVLLGVPLRDAAFLVAGSPLCWAAVILTYTTVAADWHLIGRLRWTLQPNPPQPATTPEAAPSQTATNTPETERLFGDGPFLDQVIRWAREWWYILPLFAFIVISQMVNRGMDEVVPLAMLILLWSGAAIQFFAGALALATVADPPPTNATADSQEASKSAN